MKNRLHGQLRWMVSVAAVSLWTQAALAAPSTSGADSRTADSTITKCNVNKDGVQTGACGTNPSQQVRLPGPNFFAPPVVVTPGSVRITNRDF